METISSRRPRAARWTAATTALFLALAPVGAAAQQGALLAPPAGAGVIVILPDSLEPRPRTLSELLRDYVPAAAVQRPTGALGASAVVSLRDASVIRGDEPLVVVDGIRQVSYRAAFEPFDRRPPSILDDIPLDDVERIEILAGPAAAASYGYDGQRGAIVITTHSPGVGRPVVRASITASTADAHADYARNLSRVTATGTSCPYFSEASGNCTATGTSRYTPLLDHGPFRSAQQGNAHVGATGGLGRLGYAAALGFGRGTGTVDANAADRTTASLRLGMPLSSIAHIELASFATERGVSDGRASLFQWGVGGGPLDCSRATPCGADSTSSGYRVAPFAYLDGRGPHRRIGHLSEALAVDVAPRSNLSLRTSATADMLRDESSLLDSTTYSLGTSYSQTCANERNWRVGGSQEARLTTHVGTAIATTSLSVRFDAERSRDEIVTISRACAPPSYGNSISGASSGVFLRRDRLATSFDQRFAWGDRAALGFGAMRTTTKWWKGQTSLAPVLDPHADAMYQLVPAALPLGMLTSLRLRTAYGRTSGHDARRFSDLTDIGPTTPPYVTQFSNPRFQPDRSTELEAGFDAAFSPASTRLSVTAFRRRETIRGLTWIIRGSGDLNGAVTRRVAGGELVAETTPIRVTGARMHLRGQLSLTHDRVSGESELLAVSGPGGLLGVTNGESWEAWRTRGYRWTDANSNGRIEASELQDGGFSGPAGRSRPSLIASLGSRLEITRSLTLSALVDHVGGYDVYNRTSAEQCFRFACPALNDPRAPLGEQARAVVGAIGATGGFVVPGDATRLREITLAYRASRAAAMMHAASLRVSLSAYDVASWTRSKGTHPETDMPVSGKQRQVLASLVQPIPRTIALRVSFGW